MLLVRLCHFVSNDLWLPDRQTDGHDSYTTVTLPKPTVGRWSASKILENRATLADCRPTSVPILAEFLVGRRLFCRSTKVKSFVDRSADFHGFCHRRSVGRWSADNRPTVGRRFEEIYVMISAEGRPIIGRQSLDDRQTVGRWGFIKDSSANRRRYRPSFGRWSPDCRPIIKCGLCYIFFIMHVSTLCMELNHALMLFWNSFHWTLCANIIWRCFFCYCWISKWTIRMTFWTYVFTKYFT